MSGTNQSVHMTLSDLAQIRQYPLPEGYSIRTYSAGDASAWYRIHRAAEPYFEIADGLMESEFAQDPAALTDRCFFLCDGNMSAVGTVTAWWNDNWRGGRWGQVHWLAIHPDYQGLGLCKPLMSVVMNRIRLSDSRCYLGTSTGRKAAIKVYLDFGFIPDLNDDGEREAWVDLGFAQK